MTNAYAAHLLQQTDNFGTGCVITLAPGLKAAYSTFSLAPGSPGRCPVTRPRLVSYLCTPVHSPARNLTLSDPGNDIPDPTTADSPCPRGFRPLRRRH